MPLAPAELVEYVRNVQADVLATNEQFADLFSGGAALPPIPFFGDPTRASIATVGVNPSQGEFSAGRSWPREISASALTERLLRYFVDERVPPHPWFGEWEAALQVLGASYRDNTVHLDLSPRATLAMGEFRKEKARLFLRMVARDQEYLFRLLSVCPGIRVLLSAGAVTSRHYMIEFLRKTGTDGLQFREAIKAFQRVPGIRGSVGMYEVEVAGHRRLLFFCASGPSDRGREGLLRTRVRESVSVINPWLTASP